MNKWTQSVLLSFLLSLASIAQAEDWYTVEVIIFANTGNEALDDEYWPEINEVPLKTSITLTEPTQSDDELTAFQKLTPSLLSLNQELAQLKRSGNYRVLYHEGWMQPVAETQQPQPVRIQGGNILDNGMFELDGYIGIGKGRYLHFRPDLYFSRSLSASESAMLLKTQQAASSEITETANAQELTTLAASTATRAIQPVELFIPETLTVNLNQARRMRSKELHFIDHPLFGVLIEVKPVE
ncbi:MAG: CsiV family protein [Neptuniibacter sp.]